jgi:predicted RNase H-like HicB family nuclease
VDTLAQYRKKALKLAEVVSLGGGEGYAAKIPGFKGLLAVGGTKKEALIELQSALEDWVNLALKRGMGLPSVAEGRSLISA